MCSLPDSKIHQIHNKYIMHDVATTIYFFSVYVLNVVYFVCQWSETALKYICACTSLVQKTGKYRPFPFVTHYKM